jgi:hypothetical protein
MCMKWNPILKWISFQSCVPDYKVYSWDVFVFYTEFGFQDDERDFFKYETRYVCNLFQHILKENSEKVVNIRV